MKTRRGLSYRSMQLVFSLTLFLLLAGCSQGGSDEDNTPPPPPTVDPASDVEYWLTRGNELVKLRKQAVGLLFNTTANTDATITVDETATFQTIDGFGYTLTGGSAEVINSLVPAKKQELLQELFGTGGDAIKVSYLRVSIGASDLSSSTFTYNDLPVGETDQALNNFSLSQDLINVVPLLKEILAINPQIRILGSPWSAPLWMKDNNSFIGGSLKPEYYDVYARYFVKYIQEMKANGITIDAITPQNEPLHGGNNPSMVMTAAQQAEFIKTNLGPAFQSAGLSTRIIIYDHNCDHADYPIEVLNDPAAKVFINGSAFHLYNGNINALSYVHSQHPDKAVYFTEQYTPSNGGFEGDLKWHLKNVIIGSTRNWSRVALEWNLANNSSFGPNTPGGCTVCKGAITIPGSGSYVKNVGYYIIAHASKFVPPGSIRIGSNVFGDLNNVAFLTPAGKKVLIVENDGDTEQRFNIKSNNKWVNVTLPGGSVGTFVW
ncbi:MAG: glycoside hydrolase family 30 beta sandwich domain-containing protein [Chitinophagaceae bacterium]